MKEFLASAIVAFLPIPISDEPAQNLQPSQEECAVVTTAARDGLGWGRRDFPGVILSDDDDVLACDWKGAGLPDPRKKQIARLPLYHLQIPRFRPDGSVRMVVRQLISIEPVYENILVCNLHKVDGIWTMQEDCSPLKVIIRPPTG